MSELLRDQEEELFGLCISLPGTAGWKRRQCGPGGGGKGRGPQSYTSNSVLRDHTGWRQGMLGQPLGATLSLGLPPGLAHLDLHFERLDQKDHLGVTLQGRHLPVIWDLQVKPLQQPGHEEEELLAGQDLTQARAGSCSEGQVT